MSDYQESALYAAEKLSKKYGVNVTQAVADSLKPGDWVLTTVDKVQSAILDALKAKK